MAQRNLADAVDQKIKAARKVEDLLVVRAELSHEENAELSRQSTLAYFGEPFLPTPTAPVSFYPVKYDSLICIALKHGNQGALNALLNIYGGAALWDPNKRLLTGGTALGSAASGGHDAIMKQLLADPRTDPNVAQWDEKFFPSEPITPLMSAIAHGSDGALDQLLADPRTDVSLSSPTSKSLPLHAAALYGTPHALKALLAHPGTHVNAKTASGDTPLHLAAERGAGGAEAISALVNAGAHVNARDNKNQTPLDRSVARRSSPENVWRLVLAGAELSDPSLEPELRKIIAPKLRQRLETLAPLPDDVRNALPAELRGVIADYTDGGRGPSKAIAAAMAGDRDTLSRLSTDDLTRRDPTTGLTPLDIAVNKMDIAMVRTLLTQGVPPAPERTHPLNPRTDVMTPLMRAVQAGSRDLVELLLHYRAPTDDLYQVRRAADLTGGKGSLFIENMLATAHELQQKQIDEHFKAKGLDPESLDFQRSVLFGIKFLPENQRLAALQRAVYNHSQVILDRDQLSRFANQMTGTHPNALVDQFQDVSSEGWSALRLAPGLTSLDPQESPGLMDFDDLITRINVIRGAPRANLDKLRGDLEREALHPFDRRVLETLGKALSSETLTAQEQDAVSLLYRQFLGLPYDANFAASIAPAAQSPTPDRLRELRLAALSKRSQG